MKTKFIKATRWIVFGSEENPLPKEEQRLLILIGAIFGMMMALSFYR
jgi:hypothetical protein